MFYYFKDKHKLLEVKLEFKGHNYKFKSYEMELYSVDRLIPVSAPLLRQYTVPLIRGIYYNLLLLADEGGGGLVDRI
jgi:hypothetical protein